MNSKLPSPNLKFCFIKQLTVRLIVNDFGALSPSSNIQHDNTRTPALDQLLIPNKCNSDHEMFIWLKGIALKKFQIWPTNCPCFKSEPQFRFNNYRSLNPLVLTVLDQATVLDFHFGPYLIDEQFLGNCIWTGKPNKYTIRPFIVLNIISSCLSRKTKNIAW